jgi:hypothetical protein
MRRKIQYVEQYDKRTVDKTQYVHRVAIG